MRFIISLIFSFFLTTIAFSQTDFNLEMISNVRFTQNNEQGNDIWGYVAPDSTEYAIVGTTRNTRIYNLADPSNPIEVATIPGTSCTWRDMKSWDDHVYVTMDCGDGLEADGLLIVDMSMAPDSVSYRYWQPEIPTALPDTTVYLGACHNLYIDDDGFVYLAGCRIDGASTAIIYDLKTNKWEPDLIATHGAEGVSWRNDKYAHDIYVKDNVMYSSEVYGGKLVMYDVSDKTELVYLGEVTTSFEFCHNTWVSDDGKYAFTTDELDNAFVDSYDISDPGDIRRLDKFQPLETAGNDVVPHNAHYINGYLVTSWYTDGVVITDVSRPDNMIKVGAFDTWPDADGGTNGCWGAYPWLPSGIVIANDRRYGFFVLAPTYQRACYLEGTVTDEADGTPINAAQIKINSTEANEGETNFNGIYKTGLANAGTFEVEFTHPNYISKTAMATLENGVVTILDIQLSRIPSTEITGLVVDAETKLPIANGLVTFLNEDRKIELTADENGVFTFDLFDEDYLAVAGSWGYLHRDTSYFPSNNELVFELESGYQDDFIFDQGWEVSGEASTGIWVREEPNVTFFDGRIGNIDLDIQDDLGKSCYVTGNLNNTEARLDDVDDGTTTLTSPAMDLSNYIDPLIEFRTYFFNEGGGSTPNDELRITVSDGERDMPIDFYSETIENWTEIKSIPIKDLVDLSLPITIRLDASDRPEGHLVEAALDVFKVTEGFVSSTEDISSVGISIFPNPVANQLYINGKVSQLNKIEITDLQGKLIAKYSPKRVINIANLSAGLYFVNMEAKDGVIYTEKLIKK